MSLMRQSRKLFNIAQRSGRSTFEEAFFQGAQGERGYKTMPAPVSRLRSERFPHADQDGDLGGKSTEARNAIDAAEAMTKTKAANGSARFRSISDS